MSVITKTVDVEISLDDDEILEAFADSRIRVKDLLDTIDADKGEVQEWLDLDIDEALEPFPNEDVLEFLFDHMNADDVFAAVSKRYGMDEIPLSDERVIEALKAKLDASPFFKTLLQTLLA